MEQRWEVLDGRVKTLHPRVHAGPGWLTCKSEHAAALEQLGSRLELSL